MSIVFYGQVLWCGDCQSRTPHQRVPNGWWVCGYCGAVTAPTTAEQDKENL